MLVSEAILLSSILDQIAPVSILDIGSGSRADREIVQPHIAAAFRGFDVTWTDANPRGNMLRCDITDGSTCGGLPSCELVTACSVLEHVTDIESAMRNLESLVRKWLLVSVPHSYPEHHCPIDNMWRPSPDELQTAVERTGLRVIEAWLAGPEQFYSVPNASASMVLAIRSESSGRKSVSFTGME